MVRIIIKGGNWKNSEDEILKAAISKYGKNQWARISSLLVRKTPKQCKARWYEWLDPSIKKTEWSKEEDEKLLHLAKLMPTQWRTIAPIVGRTATQCLERYQKLLDEAESKENEELGLAGPGGEAGPSADDVRRLRPGEVDPDPETKPARPDPIDMDEDEKEMLSEARARLANTQGKKAKRKERERALEEARRLAMLQKRRELKAAGIIMRHKPKKKGMDYSADIPFEKKPASGFYDTSTEQARSYRAPIGETVRQMDKKRRTQDDEAEKKKRQKRDGAKKEGGATAFVPERNAQIQKIRDAEQISKRRKLMLPDAQVGEAELEEIVKLGKAGETARNLVEGADNEASERLLGDYSALAHAKDARTPSTAPQEDTVMLEARNLRNMTVAQTPLLGEENTPYHETSGGGTGFEGATPRRAVAATPNPLMTPLRREGDPSATPGRDVSATPRTDVSAVGRTPLRTPVRDNLSINAADDVSAIGDTPRQERYRAAQAQRQLKAAFEALPKPKNDYELVLNEPEAEEKEQRVALSEEDAADRDARLAALRAEEERRALARRSRAVQQGLPRPVDVDADALLKAFESMPLGDKASDAEKARRLVDVEVVRLLEHDMIVHPVPGGKRAGGGKSRLPVMEDDERDAARSVIQAELAGALGFPGANEATIKRAVVAQVEAEGDDLSLDKVRSEMREGYAYSVGAGRWVDKRTLSTEERIAGLADLLEQDRATMAREATKAAKGEKKLAVTLGGYQVRSKALAKRIVDVFDELERARIEMESFARLRTNEDGLAVRRRMEGLKKEVESLERRERLAQKKYAEVEEERKRLADGVEALREEVAMREAEAVNEAALEAQEKKEAVAAGQGDVEMAAAAA